MATTDSSKKTTDNNLSTSTILKYTKIKQQLSSKLEHYMNSYRDFKNELEIKNKDNIEELNKKTTDNIEQIRQTFDNLNSLLPDEKIPSIESKYKNKIYKLYKKLFNDVKSKLHYNHSLVRSYYFKTGRLKIKQIRRFIEHHLYMNVADTGDKHSVYDSFIYEVYIKISNEFEKITCEISTINNYFYEQIQNLVLSIKLDNIEKIQEIKYNINKSKCKTNDNKASTKNDGDIKNLDNKVNEIDKIKEKNIMKGGASKYTIELLDKDYKDEISEIRESTLDMIISQKNKLKTYYNFTYNVTDMIVDSQMFILYIIKALRILFTYISLFLATRIFSPIYEDIVYTQSANPPKLWRYLLVFIAFDLVFNVFIFIILFLIQFLLDDSFIVNQYLYTKYITDYVISTVILFVLGILISNVLSNKKYFRYKYEGVRCIVAYEKIMFYSAIIIYVFPYYLLV